MLLDGAARFLCGLRIGLGAVAEAFVVTEERRDKGIVAASSGDLGSVVDAKVSAATFGASRSVLLSTIAAAGFNDGLRPNISLILLR